MRARVNSTSGPRTSWVSACSAVTQPPSSHCHEYVLERRVVGRERRWLKAPFRQRREQRGHGQMHLAHGEAPAAGITDDFFDAGERGQESVVDRGGGGVTDCELDDVLGAERGD